MAALVLYLAVVAVGVFGPAPSEPVRNAGSAVRSVNPRADPRPDGAVLGRLSAEELGNVVMFVPLGVLVPMLWPRRWWSALPAGFALSGGIELVQWALLDWRSPQLRDVVWNTTGAAAGVAVWLAWQGVTRGRRCDARSAQSTSRSSSQRGPTISP